MMLRYALGLMLLTGCGQTPTASVVGPSLAFAPVAAQSATLSEAAPLAARTAAGPQPGVWELQYRIGAVDRTEELPLAFEQDGHVAVEGVSAPPSDFPNHWDAETATFEGIVRRDMLNNSAVSRDRLELAVESPTAMRGTLSLRVNFRWIAFPVTARFVRPLEGRVAVTAGAIVDTTEAERFD